MNVPGQMQRLAVGNDDPVKLRFTINNFDISQQDVEQKFIKNNPDTLRQICGDENGTPYWPADMDFQVVPPSPGNCNGWLTEEFMPRNLTQMEFTAPS